ncbi:MAG: peptide chain release factor-like protein [Planctomycetota bacterium]
MPDRSIEDIFDWLDRPAERATHPAALPADVLLSACKVEHRSSGGPGGQHRNRNRNAVSLTHAATELHAFAADQRLTEDNKRVALRRLRLELAMHHRVPVPDGEIRSDLWRERTKTGRIVLASQHRDYPAMLAEALDVLDACSLDPRKAGVRLGVSPSQLIRMIADHRPALVMINARRRKAGLHELRP